MRRHAVAAIAVVLLAVGVILMFQGEVRPLVAEVRAAFLRIGGVMAVVWLGYPQIVRIPLWVWLTIPPLVILLMRRPLWIVYLLPVILVVAALKPRPDPKKSPRK